MGADPVDLPALLARTKACEHRMFSGKLVKEHVSRSHRISLAIFRGFEGDWRDWAEIQQWASAIADALAADEPSRRAAEERVAVSEPS
jgi:hypothetical protein